MSTTETLDEEIQAFRAADHEIPAMFLNRWSPRAFSDEAVDDETLFRILEAARWAPSSANEQPWRFIMARTPEDRARFLDFLMPGNQEWNRTVPVIIVIAGKRTYGNTGFYDGNPNSTYQFDCGTAWGFLALAAHQLGLITHGMAGFDRDKARETLNIPEDYDPIAVIALGYRGDKNELSEKLQAREVPSTRRPLEELVMEGKFQGNN
jgi:nitroreductase